MFLIIYMYLFNRSLRAETHLGRDGTRLKQNAQARLKAYISMLTNWSMEIKREREKQIWKHEMKEKKTMATPNKSIKLNNFNISLWDKRKEILYPVSIATKA